MGLFFQLLINGIINGAIFSVLAISFGFVYRTTKIFHIAFAGIFTSSCYFLYVFFIILKIPLIFSILFTILLTGLLGLFIEKAIYLPFFKKDATQGVILIASLGAYISIENIIALIFGNETKILLSGIQPTYSFSSIIITKIQLFQLIAGISIIILISILLKKFKIFKIFWAIGDEPNLIPVFGIPLIKLRAILFFGTSLLVAVPSSLISLDIGMDPHQGMHYLLIAVVSVLFGGIDSFKGWWIGSFVISIIQSLVIIKFSAKFIDLVTFLILILILLFKPQGIFGIRKRMEEF